MSKIVLIGATGSIGTQTLEVLNKLKGYYLFAITAHKREKKLKKIKEKFGVKYAIITGKNNGRERGLLYGEKHLEEIVIREEVDTVIAASSGISCAKAVFMALEKGKKILLANKEILVSFGEVIKNKKNIIPIDSEHSSLFQILNLLKMDDVVNIYLTASGGPFRGKAIENLKNVSKKEILQHPIWKMGKKITVDSATLMNKALEIIEAHYLFGFAPPKIKVLIHPQSIVHSMVELKDTSIIANLSYPDMRIPILYALSYPERRKFNNGKRVFLHRSSVIEFETPDLKTCVPLRLAYSVLKRKKQGFPVVLNASNEVSVHSFLKGEIPFHKIIYFVEKTLSEFKGRKIRKFEDVIEVDTWARKHTREIIKKWLS